MGFRLVFCTRSADSFGAVRAERLKVSGNPKQYADLSVFTREQELMEELVAASRLPAPTLDISDNDVPRAVESIAYVIEARGGP